MTVRIRSYVLLTVLGVAASGLVRAPVAAAGAGISSTPSAVVCTIRGTNGNDVLRGTPHRDVICGFGGNDIIYGYDGNDVLIGGPGRDVLNGGRGLDILLGEAGDDLLIDDSEPSRIDGGAGTDNCYGVTRSIFTACEHVTIVRRGAM